MNTARSGRREATFLGLIAIAATAVAGGLLRTPGDGGSGSGYAPRTPTFVNWETPQVHPIDITPDGRRLLVTNTADNRLEVFTLVTGVPQSVGTIPVGLDPVTVRPRTSTEVWVVNHVSDSISIVNLTTMNVVKTIKTKDEPCDVVFAGTPQHAFVTCSQANTVQVFDPANLATAATNIAIDGNDPRSLAVSPDGSKVYAAIFESGNASTILGGGGAATGTRLAFPPDVVSDTNGPYSGVNPPPNSGASFSPPIAPANAPANHVGLIVKKNAAGHWMDDNNHDWTAKVSGANAADSGRVVGWDLPDRDLAVINTSSLSVSYATGLMNICMSVGVNPATGQVTVIGTDATNEVRFEPNVKGKFTRVNMATIDPASLSKSIVDLNPHLLPYSVSSVAQSERDKSIGDPRAIVWLASGAKGYVAGMGSNNVIAINAVGARLSAQPIPVDEGPTGLCLDEAHRRLFVLSKFAASVTVINLDTDTIYARTNFYDPSPTAIKVGRKHLYDTHKNSGLGQLACASCHVDARMDRLSWDLGDPSGAIAPLAAQDLNLGFNFPGLGDTANPPANPAFDNFHPMKGPMTTQTLQDIIGHEPFHWRGDRRGIENFGPAFMSLNGDDTTLTTQEMQEFEDFLATIYFPPNPNRNFDNTLPTSLPLPGHYTTGRFTPAGAQLPNGNAQNGLTIYRSPAIRFDGGAFACATCHTLPTGGGPDMRLTNFTAGTFAPILTGPQGQHHVAVVSVDGSTNVTIKIPQLRNEYLKTSFDCSRTTNNAGFGVLHDGSVDSLERFVSEPVFNMRSDQDVADLVALLLSFGGSDFGPPPTRVGPFDPPEPPGPLSQDTHAAVGVQTTLIDAANPDPGQLTLIASMISLANTNKVGLVVKGRQNGLERGYTYTGSSTFQSDHVGQTITAAALQSAAAPGSELTYTVVVKGTETRIGIDRNLNGILDFDEPPLPPVCGQADFNNDGDVGTDQDIEAFFACLGGTCCPLCGSADFNNDGDVGTDSDIESFFRVLGGGSC